MWPLRIGFSMVVASSLLLGQGNSTPPQGQKMASETQVPGDPAKGLALFEGKGGCLSCHRVADEGSRIGVDLSEVAKEHTVAELQRALLEPNPEVQSRNQLYRVVTRDGKTVIGRILNQDEFSLQMVGSDDQLHAFLKSTLRESGFTKTPSMPSYRGKLSVSEETDLIAFLASLKGVAPK